MEPLSDALNATLTGELAPVKGSQQEADLHAIGQTRARISAAYKVGDVDTMMAHFHPLVLQIPAFDKVIAGKDAVRANYEATLAVFGVEMRSQLEDLSIASDMASMVGKYEVELFPKDGSASMVRAGRYMVIVRRWAESPTGWATFRELVQPGP